MAEAWCHQREVAGYAFDLFGDDPDLERFAGSLYAAACCPPRLAPAPDATFQLSRSHGLLTLTSAGLTLCRATDQVDFFRQAEWALTRAVMDSLDSCLQFHAAAVAFADGRCWLIVGPPDAGKTSLALAFAESGAAILTDEIALVTAPGLDVRPFRRDLAIHAGTAARFAELLAPVREPGWKTFDDFRFVSPTALAGWLPTRAASDLLIFPRREQGKVTVAEPVGQAAAAEKLVGQAFNLKSWGAKGIDLTAQLVERCPAYAVCFDDPRDAAATVSMLRP